MKKLCLHELWLCLTPTVILAGLGYFIDLFDLTLFSVVRTSSLKGIGISDPQGAQGLFLYNCGMAGMILGGVIWGIMADKKGRLSVMFASIALYSLSNIANAFVWNINSYALCRFFCGLGLAGELGAAVTLVAESLPREKRGIGTTVVATLGMLGVLCAAIVGQILPWKASYILGGVLGLSLLLSRLNLAESEIFIKCFREQILHKKFLLFRTNRMQRYLQCILAGLPIYFTTGILFSFAPELCVGTKSLGNISAGNAILYGSVGLTLGDFCFGLLSQYLQSRKKAIALGIFLGFIAMIAYTQITSHSQLTIYILCFLLGIAMGYWAVLITVSVEQFGTNLRGTVSSTVPNFVRGSAILTTSAFAKLNHQIPAHQAAFLVGAICFSIALISVLLMPETFHKDLSYREL